MFMYRMLRTDNSTLTPAQASEAQGFETTVAEIESLTILMTLRTASTISAGRISEPRNMNFQASFWICSIFCCNIWLIHFCLFSLVAGTGSNGTAVLSLSLVSYSSISCLFSFRSFSYAEFHNSTIGIFLYSSSGLNEAVSDAGGCAVLSEESIGFGKAESNVMYKLFGSSKAHIKISNLTDQGTGS